MTHHDGIDDRAAQWAARLDRAPLRPPEEEELRRWLEEDRRHVGALARARAVSVYFDRARALGKQYDPSQFAASQPVWHRVRWRAVGAIAAIGCVLALIGAILLHRDALSTGRGEVRIVALPDGSSVTLNTSSTLQVSFTRELRKTDLLGGEVLFTVAKDPRRPFIVSAGSTQVRAVGTSFVVRRLPGEPVTVMVREGVVEVSRPEDLRSAAIRVSYNTIATSASKAPLSTTPIEPPEISRQLAWRDGMISLDGMTLAQAAKEFSRYSDFLIVIDDPATAQRRVTGLFSATDPRGFAQAVARSLDLEAEIDSSHVRLHP